MTPPPKHRRDDHSQPDDLVIYIAVILFVLLVVLIFAWPTKDTPRIPLPESTTPTQTHTEDPFP